MKKLLFLGIVVLMVESLGAVTLPSTSYSPYAGSTPSADESFTVSEGTIYKGNFSQLSSDACSSEPTTAKCQSCCANTYSEAYNSCLDACMSEPGSILESCEAQCATSTGLYGCMQSCDSSLPLDGGLSILLILSLAGGAAKLLRNRDKE